MCPCESITCLNVLMEHCAATVTLPVNALETGQYLFVTEFNGFALRATGAVTQGEKIQAPAHILNGNYTHVLRIYRPDNSLLNATCYKLKTMVSSWHIPLPYPPPSGDGGAVQITLAAEMVSEDGLSFTSAAIAGRTLLSFDTDNQSPNRAQFTQSGNEITRTDGGSFYDGQIITLHFGTIDS